MKALLTLTTSILMTAPAFGADILNARISSDTQSIELEVFNSGGCAEHSFDLEVNSCSKSSPVKCFVDLVHNTNDDACEMGNKEKLSFSLKELGFNTEYFKNATLTIRGDNGTSTVVTLEKSKVIPSKISQDETEYSLGDQIKVREGKGQLPVPPAGYKWQLKSITKSNPAQYVFELVKI